MPCSIFKWYFKTKIVNLSKIWTQIAKASTLTADQHHGPIPNQFFFWSWLMAIPYYNLNMPHIAKSLWPTDSAQGRAQGRISAICSNPVMTVTLNSSKLNCQSEELCDTHQIRFVFFPSRPEDVVVKRRLQETSKFGHRVA